MPSLQRIIATTARELLPAALLLVIAIVVIGLLFLALGVVAKANCVDGAFGLGEICGNDR